MKLADGGDGVNDAPSLKGSPYRHRNGSADHVQHPTRCWWLPLVESLTFRRGAMVREVRI